MAEIFVAHESEQQNYAKELAERLRGLGHSVHSLAVDRYPVADVMHLFILSLSEQSDAAFVLISARPEGSVWISRELRHWYEQLANVFPCYLPGVSIPDWWQGVIGCLRFESAEGVALTNCVQLGLNSRGGGPGNGGRS